jgi:hypothetical protein
VPTDCPATICEVPSCVGGWCYAMVDAGRELEQSPGDCRSAVCDQDGAPTSVDDDDDRPDPGTACLVGVCEQGVASTSPAEPRTPCDEAGGSLCDGRGACVGCLDDEDCPAEHVCSPERACAPATCDDGIQDGGEAGLDCGGPDCAPCPVVVVLGSGPAAIVGASLHPAEPGATFVVTPLGGASSSTPALALAETGVATGLLRDDAGGALVFATWQPDAWSGVLPVGPNVTTAAGPSAAAIAGVVSASYLGTDHKHYFAERDDAWLPFAEPVAPPAGVHSFGPTPATITALGGERVLAYAGGDGDLYDQRRVGGAWQAASAHAVGFTIQTSPALAALDGGAAAELLVVFVRTSDQQLFWSARAAGSWSAPTPIAGAFTTHTPSLAALAGGDALLAFRGADDRPYAARFTGGAWTAPAGVASPNPTLGARPAVCRGAAGAEAELAIVDSSGAAFHLRLVGGSWSAPSAIGATGLTHIAVAAGP